MQAVKIVLWLILMDLFTHFSYSRREKYRVLCPILLDIEHNTFVYEAVEAALDVLGPSESKWQSVQI